MIRRPPRSTLFPYTTALPISRGTPRRRSLGAGHARAGARDLALRAEGARRSPPLRHDVHPGADRAPVWARAAVEPGRGGGSAERRVRLRGRGGGRVAGGPAERLT